MPRSCHQLARDRDTVESPRIRLSNTTRAEGAFFRAYERGARATRVQLCFVKNHRERFKEAVSRRSGGVLLMCWTSCGRKVNAVPPESSRRPFVRQTISHRRCLAPILFSSHLPNSHHKAAHSMVPDAPAADERSSLDQAGASLPLASCCQPVAAGCLVACAPSGSVAVKRRRPDALLYATRRSWSTLPRAARHPPQAQAAETGIAGRRWLWCLDHIDHFKTQTITLTNTLATQAGDRLLRVPPLVVCCAVTVRRNGIRWALRREEFAIAAGQTYPTLPDYGAAA